jgi:hypothetical protein
VHRFPLLQLNAPNKTKLTTAASRVFVPNNKPYRRVGLNGHEAQRGKKREKHADTVEPCSESDLKKRESEIETGFRLKPYGPLEQWWVVGRLPGTEVPASRNARTAERKRAPAANKSTAPIGALTEAGSSRTGQNQ